MNRIWLALAVFLGTAALVAPASAAVTYTLNCSTVACGTSGNYGTVSLSLIAGTGLAGDASNKVEVTVNLISAGNTFAGTGAGYAINWNITGNPDLTTALIAAVPPVGGTYSTSNFAIQDSTTKNHTYKASPFGNNWMYAIDSNQNGGNSGNDNYLVFDVTSANGIRLQDFTSVGGFFFAVDIFGGPCHPTCVVASNTSVPEPSTVLMIIAGLGSLFMFQRRRKLARAV